MGRRKQLHCDTASLAYETDSVPHLAIQTSGCPDVFVIAYMAKQLSVEYARRVLGKQRLRKQPTRIEGEQSRHDQCTDEKQPHTARMPSHIMSPSAEQRQRQHHKREDRKKMNDAESAKLSNGMNKK